MRSINNLNLIKELAENTYKEVKKKKKKKKSKSKEKDIVSEKLQDNKDTIEKSSSDTSTEPPITESVQIGGMVQSGVQPMVAAPMGAAMPGQPMGVSMGAAPMGAAMPGQTMQMQTMGRPMGAPMQTMPGQPMQTMGRPMGAPTGMPMGAPMGMPMGAPMGMPMGAPMGMPMGAPMLIRQSKPIEPSNSSSNTGRQQSNTSIPKELKEQVTSTIKKNFFYPKEYNSVTGNFIKPVEYPNEPLQILPLSLPYHLTNTNYKKGKYMDNYDENPDLVYGEDYLKQRIKEIDNDLITQGYHVNSRQDNLNIDKINRKIKKDEEEKGYVKNFYQLMYIIGNVFRTIIDVIQNFIHSRGVIYILALILMLVLVIMFVLFLFKLFSGGESSGIEIEPVDFSNDTSLSDYCKQSGEPINLDPYDYLFTPAKSIKILTKEYFQKNAKILAPLRNIFYTARGIADKGFSRFGNFNILDQKLYMPRKYINEPPDESDYAPGTNPTGKKNRYDNINFVLSKYFFTGKNWVKITLDPAPTTGKFDINTLTDAKYSQLKTKLNNYFSKQSENFTLTQNEIDLLIEANNLLPIYELNYIFNGTGNTTYYMNLNKTLSDHLGINNQSYLNNLIDTYISMDKPKDFNIKNSIKDDPDIPPEIRKYKLDNDRSLDDTKIITIPYKIEFDTSKNIFYYKSDCNNSYYKNIGKDSMTNLYQNNPAANEQNKCVAK